MTNQLSEAVGRGEPLTDREQDVVRLVSTGLSNKSVAGQLGVTESTVKIHLHNVYKKLRIQNRIALILMEAEARYGMKL
jgi:two-component system nitrate/nitrite response regulator NarP